MNENYVMAEKGWLQGLRDTEAALIEEMAIYELVHALMKDVRRLSSLVMETREEVNRVSPNGKLYDMTAENVFDGSYYDLPAISRYIELYGDEAIKIWEG